jgi:serine/threonine protein kinase
VSDFGCSTINGNVQVVPKGTLAYLDPEFLQDRQITEKTDVYSFGIVLIELLTGKDPLAEEWKKLTVMFQNSMRNGTLGDLLDADIVQEWSMGLIYEAAKLVSRCIAAPGKTRPDMRQVAKELRGFSDEMPESSEATTGEAKFSECRGLARVSKIGHSGKPFFPECCTRGRIALGEERLPRVP